ncbi:MAG: hypothetical protein LWX02_13635 [Deltaproteobacteria bacterium]|nr:hypothetical protein [Deltaproteobacteria bacterium]MDL1988183.1 hypothetical protein [Deltaproteobacteria bacterium]MDL2124032.1 hypothetical protein [Deltaproteobacteria bacterium]
MDRFNPKSNMVRCLIVLSLAIAGVFFAFSVWSKTQKAENECLTCHLDLHRKEGSSSYKHAPFENGECNTCHLKHKDAVRGKRTRKRQRMEPIILTNSGYLTEHDIFLKRLITGSSYNINLVFKDVPGNKVKTRLRGVIPARVRNRARNDKKPPVISGIRVVPIEKAPFLSTTIMWDSDEPSTSCIEYGLSDQYGRHSPEDIAMVKHHRVNICKLTHGKDYHFRVISRDMFGNQAVSEDCLFNPAKITGSDVTEKGEPPKLAVNNVEIFMRRKRAKSSEISLYLETSRIANVTFVECKKVKDRCTDLSVGKELTIDACRRCHPTDAIGLTHPVGVAAKPPTIVPDYLPTLSGGIMTCVTCHFAHGGELQYFARSDTISCKTCHRE